jgi:CO/xanthine dehydrogenase FAD-binding subunit
LGCIFLFKQCAEALSASFKIFNTATVGGNICMSLPAGALISLATALHANHSIISSDNHIREVPAMRFYIANNENILKTGEILRNIHIENAWLQRESLIEYRALTPIGRSAAIIITTRDPASRAVEFTITPSVIRPYQIAFEDVPTKEELADAIQSTIPHETYFDDQHGDAFYRHEMTHYLSEVLRKQLARNA